MSERDAFLSNHSSQESYSDSTVARLENLSSNLEELRKDTETRILSTFGRKIDSLLFEEETPSGLGSFRETTLEGGRTGIITSIDSSGANQYRVVVEGKVKPIMAEEVLMKKFFAWDIDSPEAEDKRKAWVQNPRAKNPEQIKQGFTPKDFREIGKVIKAFENNK